MGLDLPLARFTELLRQLQEEETAKKKTSYGWQSRVARRLGVDTSTINKIVHGHRGVDGQLIFRTCERLGLDPSFFSDAGLGDAPRYLDFVTKGTSHQLEKPAAYPEVQAFLDELTAMGTPPNASDAQELLEMRFSDGARRLHSSEILLGYLHAIGRRRLARERGATSLEHPKQKDGGEPLSGRGAKGRVKLPR